MSTPSTAASAATAANNGDVIPLFVCAGCRSEPLDYISLELGDHLDEIVACPMRDVCTWHAAHDLGGTMQYNEQPAGALIDALFRTDPYFSCPNFRDYAGADSARTPIPPLTNTQLGPPLPFTAVGGVSSVTSA